MAADFIDPITLDAVLSGRLKARQVRPLERLWIVSELTARGWGVRAIVEATGMSRRTVQRARAKAALMDLTPLVA